MESVCPADRLLANPVASGLALRPRDTPLQLPSPPNFPKPLGRPAGHQPCTPLPLLGIWGRNCTRTFCERGKSYMLLTGTWEDSVNPPVLKHGECQRVSNCPATQTITSKFCVEMQSKRLFKFKYNLKARFPVALVTFLGLQSHPRPGLLDWTTQNRPLPSWHPASTVPEALRSAFFPILPCCASLPTGTSPTPPSQKFPQPTGSAQSLHRRPQMKRQAPPGLQQLQSELALSGKQLLVPEVLVSRS